MPDRDDLIRLLELQQEATLIDLDIELLEGKINELQAQKRENSKKLRQQQERVNLKIPAEETVIFERDAVTYSVTHRGAAQYVHVSVVRRI
jgi:hypothetical protein